jgi:hypothetical protein
VGDPRCLPLPRYAHPGNMPCVIVASFHVCWGGLDHGVGHLAYNSRSRGTGLNVGFSTVKVEHRGKLGHQVNPRGKGGKFLEGGGGRCPRQYARQHSSGFQLEEITTSV